MYKRHGVAWPSFALGLTPIGWTSRCSPGGWRQLAGEEERKKDPSDGI